MRFSIRRRIGRYKFSLVIGRVTDTWGVNSALEDGQHIIMWEFDSTDENDVRVWLRRAQHKHHLPPIYLSRSHPGGGFHAYCLTRLPWLATIHIVSGTPGVDPAYVSMCAMRGHWTLRLTDKGQGAPEPLGVLPSAIGETADGSDLRSWVNYEVWHKGTGIEIGKRGL